MGSAFQTSPKSPTSIEDPTSWRSNSRKRPASVAFPSPEIARKTPRSNLVSSFQQQQPDLLHRWLNVWVTASEVMRDTLCYLMTPRPSQSEYIPPSTPESSAPSQIASLSAASESSEKTSSVSSSEPPPSSASAVQPKRASPMKPNPVPLSNHPQYSSRTSQTRVRHIYYQQHKDALKEKKRKEQYLRERAKGYTSDFSTFKSFLDYKRRVAAADHRPTVLKGTGPKSRVASVFTTGYESERLRQALNRARDSLAGPGPDKPFIPTLEQLRIADRAKDLEITKRIRYTLPVALSKEAQEEVQGILKNPRFTSKAGREQVTHQDIRRLLPGQWLNDELINFYGQLIVDRSTGTQLQKENVDVTSKPKSSSLRIHYFNTFFWPKLQQGYAKSNLKKWTKKVDLFAKDLILIPINHNQLHWSAAVINFRNKRIESYDSLDGQNSSKGRLFELLRGYLQDEHKDKKGCSLDLSEWKDYGRPDTPQQENSYDCGVFTMNFLECVARGSEFHFKQSNMPYLRQKMIFEIGKAKLIE